MKIKIRKGLRTVRTMTIGVKSHHLNLRMTITMSPVRESKDVSLGRCRYALDIFSPILKCRTAGCHAGVDLTRSTPNRLLNVHRSIDTYRQGLLTVNSIFTQSLQFINSLYSYKR